MKQANANAYPWQNDVFDVAHAVGLMYAHLHICVSDWHNLQTPHMGRWNAECSLAALPIIPQRIYRQGR